MKVKSVSDLNTPIGEVLRSADTDGVLLESERQARYAVLPLDEDLIDYLLEHSPQFIETCRQIRQRMDEGQHYTHEQVKEMLGQ